MFPIAIATDEWAENIRKDILRTLRAVRQVDESYVWDVSNIRHNDNWTTICTYGALFSTVKLKFRWSEGLNSTRRKDELRLQANGADERYILAVEGAFGSSDEPFSIAWAEDGDTSLAEFHLAFVKKSICRVFDVKFELELHQSTLQLLYIEESRT
jgi:hypothetical protein